jgi:hypothetical protein
MAAITKNTNYVKWPKLLHNRSKSAKVKSSYENLEYNMLKSSSLCLYSSNLGTFWLQIQQFWPFEDMNFQLLPILIDYSN